MERTSPTARRRIFPTPRGMAELDIAGTERQAFVTVTVFDDQGWATDEAMWWSGHGESLAERLSRLTDLSRTEADAVAGDFIGTWQRRGGPAQGAASTHRFGYGLVGTLLAVAGVSALGTWAVGRRSGV